MSATGEGGILDTRLPSEDGLPLYRSVNQTVFDLYDQDELEQGLAVVDSTRDRLAPWDAELAVLAACLHGRLGHADEALDELLGAADRGGWWDPSVLADDDDLAVLRGSTRFQDLLRTVADRWREANDRVDRSGDVLVEASSARHLLIALHGAEEDASDAVEVWGPVAKAAGSALLAVRSSQRTSPRYRTWPDHTRAVQEVTDAWSRLPARLRGLPVITAGFSAGGRIALRLGLEATSIPTTATVAVAPAIEPSDVERGPGGGRRITGTVWIGSCDSMLPQVEETRERLAAAGVDLVVVEGLGHSVPADLSSRVLSAPIFRDEPGG